MDNRKKKNIVIYSVIICTLILVGFLSSYAYFINTPKAKNQEVSVETGNLSLIFEDGTSSFQGTLNFGDSATKTFTIENNGSLDAKAVMYFDNLVNTYTLGSLTYTLSYSETEDGEYQELVTNSNVPRSEESTFRILADNLSIPSKEKYYYKLIITLNYLDDVDQTVDLNAILSAEFSIEEEKKTSTITFNSVGGASEVVSKKVAIESPYGELPRPTKEGFIFLGWFTEENDGVEVTSDSIVNTIENHTLYAHWKEDKISSEEILAKLGKTVKSSQNLNFETPEKYNDTSSALYSLEDDYGTSYFYRGNVTDNYVKFAGFYWRIIRINGDGSIRLLYDGTSAHTNSASKDRFAWIDQKFNTNTNDNKYVGYMFGGANGSGTSKKRIQLGDEGYEDSSNTLYNETSSDIKIKLEEWYVTNIKNKNLDDKIADSIFCNDRSLALDTSYRTGTGIGQSTTNYGVVQRYNSNPKFTCPNKTDAFTVSDIEKGNGALSEKIGLITLDEVLAAGSGRYGIENRNYYLYKGNCHWTSSPPSTNAMGIIRSTGDLYSTTITNLCGVDPVINLTGKYFNTFIGDGTIGNEYRVE